MTDRRGPVLAVVQARGGSKGLPGKNLMSLGGHPLIAYSIASGLAAETVDRVIVSTDDERIAEIATSYGAEAPFLRPEELATDTAVDFTLFEHALVWLLEHERYEPSMVVQLRPTIPFRPRGFIDEAVRLLLADAAADSVRAVALPHQHPSKMWVRSKGDYIRPLLENAEQEAYNLPRQLLPEVFAHTGHLDVFWTDTVLKKRSLTGHSVKSILVDPAVIVDIDTLEDFRFAEYLLERGSLDIDLPLLQF